VTARDDFARIAEGRLDFVTGFGAVREQDIAAVLAAADAYAAACVSENLLNVAAALDHLVTVAPFAAQQQAFAASAQVCRESAELVRGRSAGAAAGGETPEAHGRAQGREGSAP
jgi:hypothetical protein